MAHAHPRRPGGGRRYGAIQPDGFQREEVPGWNGYTMPFPEYLADVADRLVVSAVGSFGWLEVRVPGVLAWALVLGLTALAVWGTVVLRPHRQVTLALGAGVVGILLVLVRESWSVYLSTGEIAGVQGRYLLPFLGALAVSAVGVQWLLGWLAERTGSRGPGVALCSVLALGTLVNAVGLVMFLVVLYPGAPLDMARFSIAAGFDPPVPAFVLLAYTIAVLGAAVLVFLALVRGTGRTLVRPRRREGGRHRGTPRRGVLRRTGGRRHGLDPREPGPAALSSRG